MANFYVRKLLLLPLIATILLLASAAVFLLAKDEENVIKLFFLVVIILFPSVLASMYVKSVALRTFIWIAFLTQLLGAPWFLYSRERYSYAGWSAVKDFSFTLSEFFNVYLPIGIFLLLVVVCVDFLLFNFSRVPSFSDPLRINDGNQAGMLTSRKRKNQSANFTLLIAVIAILAPFNLWMFKNGIALVGIEPPRLPFKLSGILYYFTKFVVPIALAIIYARTSRGSLPAFLMAVYGFTLGITQISRSVMVFVMIPVLYFAYRDRRRLLLFLSSVFVVIGFQIITLMRNVVYLPIEGRITSDTASGLLEKIKDLVETQEFNFDIFGTLFGLIARLDAAQGMVLAYQYNTEAVGGWLLHLKRFIYQGWVSIDSDAFNLEYIGLLLPSGFATGGGFLSQILILTQSNMFLVAFMAAIVAMIIFSGEILARRIGRRHVSHFLYVTLALLYSFIYYIGPGNIFFWSMVLVYLIMLYVVPKNFRNYRLVIRK